MMQPVFRHATRNLRNTARKNNFDDFPTPPWGTRALIDYIFPALGIAPQSLKSWTVWECAANRGFMQRPLGEYFGKVIASDIHDYSCGNLDFLYDFVGKARAPEKLSKILNDFSKKDPSLNNFAIITNPPFILGEGFVLRAIHSPARIIAVFARTNFLESESRYNAIYRDYPPSAIASFTKRIPLFSGRINANGSTATSYAWFVWDKARNAKTPIHLWIPPQARKKLERAGDYIIENTLSEPASPTLTG